MNLTKSQKQLVALGAILVAIVVVLAAYVFKPPASTVESFTPQRVDTSISKDVLAVPEFRRLASPIAAPAGYAAGTGTAATGGDVPLVPGATGRENPFAPY